MRYAWLEKMATDGEIRPEALPYIYEQCADLMDKTAAMDPKTVEQYKNMLVSMAAFIGLSGGAAALTSFTAGAVRDAKTQSQIDLVRSKVLASAAIPTKDKEKAKARFNEILKYAPGLGVNEAVMTRMVHDKIDGLTNNDVQNLIQMQLKMTPQHLDYAAQSQKFASQTKTAAEVAGEALAGVYLTLEKVGAFNLGTIGNIGMNTLKAMSVPLAAAAALNSASLVGTAISNATLKNKVEQSFNTILKNNPNSIISENPQKAREAFNTLAHFSPHIASEPNAAKAFIVKMLEYKTGPMPTDIKDLTDIEKNMAGNARSFFENTIQNSGVGTGLSKRWMEGGRDKPFGADYK